MQAGSLSCPFEFLYKQATSMSLQKMSARQEKLLVSLSSDLPVLVSHSWSLTPDLSVLVSWPPKVILLEEENRPYGFLLPTSLTLSEER